MPQQDAHRDDAVANIRLTGCQRFVYGRTEVGAHDAVFVDREHGFHRHRLRSHGGAHVHEESTADRPAQVIHRAHLAAVSERLVERGEPLLAVQQQKAWRHTARLDPFEGARPEPLLGLARVQREKGTDGVPAKYRGEQGADSVNVPHVIALKIRQLQLGLFRAGKEIRQRVARRGETHGAKGRSEFAHRLVRDVLRGLNLHCGVLHPEASQSVLDAV